MISTVSTAAVGEGWELPEGAATVENTPFYPYVCTIYPGEASYQACVCVFSSSSNLVVNKGDRLEIYSLDSRPNLDLIGTIKVPGWAVNMTVYKRPLEFSIDTCTDVNTDCIVIVTKKGKLQCWSWKDGDGYLEGQADLQELGGRPLTVPLLFVSRNYAFCLWTQGLLRVVNLLSFPKSGRHISRSIPTVRIDELSVSNILVSGTETNGLLVVLYQTPSNQSKVKFYKIPDMSARPKSLSKCPPEEQQFEQPAYTLFNGGSGYYTFTYDHVLYHDPYRGIKVGRTIGATAFDAICDVADGRLLAIDSDGMLSQIQLEDDFVQVSRLGRCGLASCMAYLGDGMVFLGSKNGDNCILNLEHLDTPLKVYPAIGPLLDSQLCDIDGTGHEALVSCSGSHRNGGISILRSGVEIQVSQETPFPVDISDVDFFWHRSKRYLTVKLIEESYVFGLTDSNELEETTERFIPSGEAILLTKNVFNGVLLVVTSRRISVYKEAERRSLAFKEQPCEMAVVSGDLVAIVLRKSCHRIDIYQCTPELDIRGFGTASSSFALDPAIAGAPIGTGQTIPGGQFEVAAMDIRKAGDVAYLSVAYWNVPSVFMFKVQSGLPIEEVLRCELPLHSTPRSILMLPAGDSNWYVFVGFVNGSVGYFRTHQKALFKIISTSSTTPTRLFKYSKGTVFVSGDHPAFIRVDRNGLVDVLPTDLLDVSAFALIPSAMVLCQKGSLRVCRLDERSFGKRRHLKVIRWRDLDFGTDAKSIHQVFKHEHPVCISVGLKAAVVCTLDDLPGPLIRPDYPKRGRLAILNKKTFSVQEWIEFEDQELPISCIFAKLDGCSEQLLYVGTMRGSSRFECGEGRILVYHVSSEFKCSLQCEVSVDGPVYRLDQLESLLAVSINGKVSLFKFKQSPKPALHHQSDFYGQILIESTSSQNRLIALGDHLKSIMIAGLSNGALNEVSRNTEAHSMRAVHLVDQRRVFGGDANGNLLCMVQVQNTIYLDTRFQTLYITSSMFFGSPISKFVPLQGKENALFTTESGRVGIIGHYKDPSVYEKLLRIQEKLESGQDEKEAFEFMGNLAHPTVNRVLNGDLLFEVLGMTEGERAGVECDEDALKLIEALYSFNL